MYPWDETNGTCYALSRYFLHIGSIKVYVIQQDSVWEGNVLKTQTVETAGAQALQRPKERVGREKVSTFLFI